VISFFILPIIKSKVASHHGLLAGIRNRCDKLGNAPPELHNESGV